MTFIALGFVTKNENVHFIKVFSDKEKVVPTNVGNVTVCNLWSLVYPYDSPSEIKYQKQHFVTHSDRHHLHTSIGHS